jgi:hypothetical protein
MPQCPTFSVSFPVQVSPVFSGYSAMFDERPGLQFGHCLA